MSRVVFEDRRKDSFFVKVAVSAKVFLLLRFASLAKNTFATRNFSVIIYSATIFVLLLPSSCSLVDPMTRAQHFSQKGKFAEAIKLLENEFTKQPNSVPVKSLLAQAYSDYGLALCQDPDRPPKEKYPMAKEQFAMALTLNPYLKDAMDMYDTIEQIQKSLESGKLNQ